MKPLYTMRKLKLLQSDTLMLDTWGQQRDPFNQTGAAESLIQHFLTLFVFVCLFFLNGSTALHLFSFSLFNRLQMVAVQTTVKEHFVYGTHCSWFGFHPDSGSKSARVPSCDATAQGSAFVVLGWSSHILLWGWCSYVLESSDSLQSELWDHTKNLFWIS